MRAALLLTTLGLAVLRLMPAEAAKPLPDLMVSSLTAPTSASPGETISIIYTVQNVSDGQADGSTLSATLMGVSGLMLLGNTMVPRLQKGRTVTSALNVMLPASLISGNYTLTLTADVLQAVIESNEGNNSRSVPLSIVPAAPGEALLTWNPNPEPDIAGYKTHYGTASRGYSTHTDVGNVTSALIRPLARGFTYYFALTAVNLEGLESQYSLEVYKTIP